MKKIIFVASVMALGMLSACSTQPIADASPSDEATATASPELNVDGSIKHEAPLPDAEAVK